jgi:hypothetical protein
MTHQPDDRQPDESGQSGADHPLDEDAAWRAIVANYGERPDMFDSGPDDSPPSGSGSAAVHDQPRDVFDRSYLDSLRARAAREHTELNTGASWNDEGHFVPPAPPPLPAVEPRRKAAWIGLFGGPALMLLGVVLGWDFPDLILGGLVMAFVGGFVYLVATMQRTGRGDGWSGDDGAVV